MGVDWLDRKQAITIGSITLFKGIVTEWARRLNDPLLKARNEFDSHLAS